MDAQSDVYDSEEQRDSIEAMMDRQQPDRLIMRAKVEVSRELVKLLFNFLGGANITVTERIEVVHHCTNPVWFDHPSDGATFLSRLADATPNTELKACYARASDAWSIGADLHLKAAKYRLRLRGRSEALKLGDPETLGVRAPERSDTIGNMPLAEVPDSNS